MIPNGPGSCPRLRLRQVLVGFAAETDTSPEQARAKLDPEGL